VTYSPKDIPKNITGTETPTLHSEIPQSLSDFANPTVTDPQVAANFLFENILLTNPGEKLSDPNFGVGLRSFLFEPTNNLFDLQNVISEQLGRYAQGIRILSVDVDLSGVDGNAVFVSVKYLNPNKTIGEYLLNTDLGSAPSAVYV
jgi:phage baseplate assembly protein W